MRPGTRWKRRTRAERANRRPTRPISWGVRFYPSVPIELLGSVFRSAMEDIEQQWVLPPGDFGIIQTNPQPTHWLDNEHPSR